ncbi:MAG: rRNA maturation RNase YbeY [Verrucomicrobiales bacterium]
MIPKLYWVNRQKRHPIGGRTVLRFLREKLPDIISYTTGNQGTLRHLEEVCFVCVGPRTMQQLHFQFLRDPSLTDVITFDHGEVVVCAEVAFQQAQTRGLSLDWEICLYCLHGLLHLQGFDDLTPSGAKQMRVLQKRLMRDFPTV